MNHLSIHLLPVAQLALVAMFGLLAISAFRRARRTGATGWLAAGAFGSLAVALAGAWIPEVLGRELPDWADSFVTLPLVAFPYLLLRFAASFRPFPRWLEIAAGVTLAVIVIATVVRIIVAPWTTPRTVLDGPYNALALAYWFFTSLAVVIRLWQAGEGQPTVPRRRMRLMSLATAVQAVALILGVLLDGLPAAAELAIYAIALVSAGAFGLGFSPPRLVRLSWRRREEEHLRRGTIAVLRATTAEEIARELLPPTVRIIGAGGAAIVEPGGRVISSHGDAPPRGSAALGFGDGTADPRTREVASLGKHYGSLVVWTSHYTRYFGREETDLLETMAAIAGLALDRCELLQDERGQRVAVEAAQRDAERARDEAHRANMAKSEFLSRMSHELRTPLNAILGFGQLLETSDLSEEDHDAIRYINKAGRHLLALINDVLDLSRIETGSLTVSPEPVHAGELIEDALALINPMAESRSIQMSYVGDDCDAYVTTDRQRCRQILLNLLSNAVKYNYDGGQVSLRCAPRDDATLRISVRDTGPGIDPARQERLFQPFERLGAEGTGVEGTGLGLALSKQLVERLGGAIGVETATGQGATFWIDLPLTERPADTQEPMTEPAPRPSGSQRTLLLVEDNVTNLRVVEAMLRRRPGIAVVPAMQGRMALDLAREHRPDVIVLDLHLPDLPGRDVLLRLKADAHTRGIPVIVASADATPGRMQQLREDGALAYLTKPLDLQRFLELVDEAIGARTESATS